MDMSRHDVQDMWMSMIAEVVCGVSHDHVLERVGGGLSGNVLMKISRCDGVRLDSHYRRYFEGGSERQEVGVGREL